MLVSFSCSEIQLLDLLTSKIANGTEESNTRRSAGAAAFAKNASSEADQITVAKEVNPIGLRINVTGSSFIVSKNAKTPPAKIPFQSNGTVIERSILVGVLPRLEAASSRLWFICLRLAWI